MSIKRMRLLFAIVFLLLSAVNLVAHANNDTFTKRFRSTSNFDVCNDVNWATWDNFSGLSAIGTINNGGDLIKVTMTSNFTFSSTPAIYNHSKFLAYPDVIPNATVPQTTWSKGDGGTTTMCFSKKVANPVLLIASLGASDGTRAKLSFSKPYVVLFDGGGMTYHNNTSLTGVEGYAIVMFPGDFDCVTVNSTTPEFYTNITWGTRPPPFAISISESKSCESTTLQASGGVSYLWDGGDTPTNATNTFRTSGTYIVTVTDVNGCKNSFSKEVNITGLDASVTELAADCETAVLQASGGVSYLWSGGTDPTNAINTFKQSGRYTVKITGITCSTTLVADVVVSAITNNSISTPQTIFCNPTANVVLTGTLPQTIATQPVTLTFRWEKSTDGINWAEITDATAQSFSTTTMGKSTFFRRATQINNSCKSYSNELKIEVSPLATSANAGPAINLCNVDHVVLNANEVSVNEIGTWSVVSPLGYHPFDDLTIHDPKAAITAIPANTEIVLKWTIKQQVGCMTETSDEIRLINYGTPTLTMPSNMTINEGQSLPIPAGLSGAAGVTYTFQWTPAAGLDDPTLLSPTLTPLETSIYQLHISYGTCSIVKEIKVILNKAKQIESCSGLPLTLIGAVDNDNASRYQWQMLINGVWTAIANATQADYSVTNTENFADQNKTTAYRRLVENAPYYDSRYLVTILPTTTNNIITATQTIFCANEVASINITGSTPTGAQLAPLRFLWEQSIDGLTWVANGATTKDLAIANLTTTTYYRRLTFADDCSSYSNTLLMRFYPPATIANAGQNQSLCGATSLVLGANPPGNNETGEWQVVSPLYYQPFDAQSIHDPQAKINAFPQNEPVILKWTIRNSNCGTSTDMEVAINSFVTVVIQAPTSLNIAYGTPAPLGISANLPAQQLYKFEWRPSAGLSDPNSLNPMAMPEDNTTYTLTINYGANCISSKSISVKVLRDISLPNSFSPNGDGINETWQIKGLSNYPGSRLSIFNRYGAIVFEGGYNSLPWDGRYKGKLLPIGAYFYVLTLKDKNNTNYKGSIAILN
jgi:gliding motility-associated-like protein